ncbi:MAG: hypothetical protein NTZ26_13315 [Candidatus Aminicenantes bacterium]|nr:hypothetical protein [Candidatus Aminicenantes bacterium]
MRKTALTLFIAFGLAAAAAFAQTPDLSGEWKLNSGRSDLGDMAAADPSITLSIRQEAGLITIRKTISIVGREVVKNFRYTLDGKEALNAGESLKELKGAAAFDKGILLVRSEQEGMTMTSTGVGEPEIEYFKYNSVEAFSLSADGKTLTLVHDQQMPDGARRLTYVFEKLGS